jgi:hypothetical protein
MTTRKTKCVACGCHEVDPIEARSDSGAVLPLWKCVDCGLETPRPISRRLDQRKSRLVFETSAVVKDGSGPYRAVVVEPKPLIAVVRLKGRRVAYEVSWEGVYHWAVKLAVAKAKAEKKAARRGRKTL